MLIHHIILLLLSWPCARAIEDEKPPPDDVFDQIATASENSRVAFNKHETLSTSLRSLEKQTTPSIVKATTVHYENSNGFVPMTSMDKIMSESSVNPEISDVSFNNDDGDNDETIGSLIVRESSLLDNDPAYSTEARMFLNLAGPRADRRSFDAQDGQSEFEILKVNNETPAIANYHEFYENMQSNLNRNRGGTQQRYEESKEPTGGRTVGQNKRTKERIKKIEKYLTNFHGELEQDNADPYKQYYNNFAQSNSRPVNRQKEIFEPEKVQTNYHQESGSSIYDSYSENPLRQRTSSIVRSNYDNSVTSSRQKSYPSVSTKNRHSKPVVVVEPSDYKLDMKYEFQQSPVKTPSSVDHYKSHKYHKEPEVELGGRYDEESRVNREDRYGQNYEKNENIDDYSDEVDYLEITEKPRRIHKNRRRPYITENSRRLPKEHRGHLSHDLKSDDSRENNSPTREKLHRPKAKPSYWIEDDRGPLAEDISNERPNNARPSITVKPEEKNPRQNSKGKVVNSWSQAGPNIEISHSNGFELDQIDKPKILVPVNLNLVPLSNFDHSTALGNGQGFDFTNVPNFVTAPPVVSSPTSLLSTSQSLINSGNSNLANLSKNNPNHFNNNYGLSTAVPDIIVGQNTYQNPVQAVIFPQMNVHNKFTSNLRSNYASSTSTPMFTMTHTLNPNLQNIGPTVTSMPVQHFQSTLSPRNVNFINPNLHHLTVNPVSPAVPQLLLSQPTHQTFPLLHAPYSGNANYNILVNPNGLNGQTLIQHGNSNAQSATTQNSQPSSTTPQPNTITSNNFHASESQIKKNSATGSNGQFVATASFSVGNGGQQEQQQQSQLQQQGNNLAIDNKSYLSTNNQNGMNSNEYYDENKNNQQLSRPQQQENFYQIYRDDPSSNDKMKTYIQTAQVVPAIIHPGQAIPVNFNNHQNYASVAGQLQEQQSVLNPNIVAQRPRDQNQQILKAANDIFENTWKQLQQLQNNEDAARTLPYQHVYRVNDNFASTSNTNANTANHLSSVNVNSAKAHLPILSTQNVEIINPNIKPSPVDFTLINPYETINHYPAAVLTTPIPIFSTTANFLVPRPVITSTTPQSINLQNYVDSLTQIGAQSNQVNKLEPRPGTRSQDNQVPAFNPINFVPNIDLIKSQSMLNSKLTESLPHQLNLVPVIPGGNFFKNTQGAQTELVQKPRLSSDLEKYADEMFKESLKTMYSTHKWNTDRRLQGNYSAAELNDLAKLKSELQRFKASLPDSKYNGKDILEGHHSETKVRTAEPSNRPTKKPELTIAEIEQLFKSDFKLNLPMTSSDSSHHSSSHHKNRPGKGHGSSRPSNDHSNVIKNIQQLTDYLTPPKRNSFISKSPFIDSPKNSKKRPGSSSSRYNSNNGNNRFLPRPSSLLSKPASNPEASASNQLESGIHADNHHRHEKYKQRPGQYSRENKDNYEPSRYASDHSDYRSYPTFTTTSAPDNDHFKPSSSDQSFKTDYYDINHPRMHNLLGLLMKNKQLPTGISQSYFQDEDHVKQFFENEKRRIHSQFYDENMTNFEKKSDPPINMGPPAPPQAVHNQYYSGQGAA